MPHVLSESEQLEGGLPLLELVGALHGKLLCLASSSVGRAPRLIT